MRFKIVREVAARYVEVHELDAVDAEEAERGFKSGQTRCTRRAFETTPGRSFSPLRVLQEHEDEGFPDFEYPAGQTENMAAFNNARFVDLPGLDHQRVVQDRMPE